MDMKSNTSQGPPQSRQQQQQQTQPQPPLRSPHISDAELAAQREATLAANRARDEMAERLAQNNERLAELLSESANCMLSLLPAAIPSLSSDHTPTPATASITAPPGTEVGLQNFEARGQEWFMTLNDVQLVLRSAVRQLRDAQVSPLTAAANLHDGGVAMMGANRSSASRPTAEMGAAGRGHGLSLLHPFAKRGNESVILTEPAEGSITPSMPTGPVKVPNIEDIALSLSALRRQKQGWEDLRKSLEALGPAVGPGTSGYEAGRRSSLPNVSGSAAAEASSAAAAREEAKRSRRQSDESPPRRETLQKPASISPPLLESAIVDDDADERRARAKVDLDRQALAQTVASADRRLLDALFATKIPVDFARSGSGGAAGGPVSLGGSMAPASAEQIGSTAGGGGRSNCGPNLTVSSRPQVSE